MKKLAVITGWTICVLAVSLLTVSFAAANTSPSDPTRPAAPAPAVPLKATSSAPDAFGYTYQDEVASNGPTFGFINISGSNVFTFLDDDDAQNIPAGSLTGFDFEFYGVPLSDLRVSKNGAILFNNTTGFVNFDNICLSGAAETNLIAPWWDDWGSGGNVYWDIQGTAPNRRLIVQWDQVIHLKDVGQNDSVTFEAILFETSNVILFQYQDTTAGADVSGNSLSFGNSGTVGIRETSAANTLQYETCNSPVLADSRAIRFQRSSLTITKDANPDDPQNFTFTTSITTTPTFTLDDDLDATLPNTRTFFLLPTGSYTVTENSPPATWGLANLTCASSLAAVSGFTGTTSIFTPTLGTRSVAASLAPGDDLNCTFTNQNFGTIVITKATVPITDTQDFTFTSNITGSTAFTLDTDSGDVTFPISQTFTNLIPGAYSVQESALNDWDLTALTCNDPTSDSSGSTITRTATINLAAGETVACTFTNTKRGTIVIQKATDPASDPQVFTFTTSIPTTSTFTLDTDPGSTNPPNSITFNQIVSGTYTVQENAIAGWNLTGLVCDDGSSVNLGSRTATIGLSPGETVTCIFTNTKRGTIEIVKDALPDDPQDFAFTTSITTTPTFNLDDDTNITLPNNLSFSVSPGVYTVTETAIPNWTLTNLGCNDGDSTGNLGTQTATINVAAGEAITCTFTNVADPSILIVQKATNPATDPQVFTFTTTIPATPTFTLDTDGPSATPISRTLVISTGTYSVSESTLPDWNLTGATCDDGSTVSNIDIGPGETVTCTFTNTKRGTIIINKTTSPGNDPQDFTFSSNIPGNASFSLDTDPGSGSPTNSQTFFVVSGSYTVTEAAVSGWDLIGLNCVDSLSNDSDDSGAPTAIINVDVGETVTCTFINAKRGTIQIIKDAVPNNAQDFDFTSDIPGNTAFTLDDDPGDATRPSSQIFPNLITGSYLVTETLPIPNWSLTNVNCVDPSGGSSGNTGTGVATINLAPGETVICTFTNQAADGNLIITKVTNPGNDIQVFTFTTSIPTAPTFTLDTNPGSGTPVSQTFVISPGVYSVSEGALPDWDLTGSTCNDGSALNSINIAPGETVTCTFTNTKRGTIIIDKVTNPAQDPQDFGFNSNIPGNTTFFLDTDSSDATFPANRIFLVQSGTYSVTEPLVTGWNLSGLTCVDTIGAGSSGNLGTRTADINISAGETVTCTFTNAALPGSITISKNAVPNDPQDFAFILTGVSTTTTFFLDDDSNPTLPVSRTFSGLVHGTYLVVEGATTNWSLNSLTCVDPTGNTITNPNTGQATIGLGPGENITCTYTNVFNSFVGSITIVKSAVPTSTQPFTFTGSGPLGAFSLVDDGTPPNSQTFLNLNPGSYTVTEGVVTGWNLSALNCTDPDTGSTTNLGARTATIDVDSGENIICTFTNNSTSGPTTVYLPIIMKNFVVAPDLTITNLTVTGSNPNRVVTVVVQNIGNATTGEGFWVDFYVNPTTLPNNPALLGDRRWNNVGSSQGIAWQVPPLAGGASVTLTSDGSAGIGPSAPQTSWNGTLPSGANVYAFADSFDLENEPFVEVNEGNENNNMSGPQTFSAAVGEPESDSDASSAPAQIPPRWDP